MNQATQGDPAPAPRRQGPIVAVLAATLVLTTALALSAGLRASDQGTSWALAADGATRIGLVAVPIRTTPHNVRKATLTLNPAGDGYVYRVIDHDGRELLLTPDAYAHELHTAFANRWWLYRILNITSPVGVAWVMIGLAGQVLFTGRMLVQWLASERRRASVVPVAFWWMSLSGATMLLVYFVWRQDIVGVLGQATGWFIYVRNLWLIYVPHRTVGLEAASATMDPITPEDKTLSGADTEASRTGKDADS